MSDPRSLASAFVRAWRSLTRRPGAFVLAVSSLAVALGLATAVLAEIASLRHPSTPVHDPDHLYSAYFFARGMPRSSAPPPRPEEIVAVLESSPKVVFATPLPSAYGSVEAGSYSGETSVLLATPRMLQVLGARVTLGRLFGASDYASSNVALISEELWRLRYGSRESLTGATVTWDSATYQVVGVLQRGFEAVARSSIVVPVAVSPRASPEYLVRVTPSTDSGTARTILGTAAQEMTRRFATGGGRFTVGGGWSYRPDVIRLRAVHYAMMGAVVLIVLIACANVSALMLARGVAGRRDQALRLALGASRADLLRTVTSEVSIIAFLAGAVGVLIALACTGALRAVMPPEMIGVGFRPPEWSPRVFVEMSAAVLLAIAVAAGAPAWYSSRIAPAEPLKDSSGTTTGRPSTRFRILVMAELALALVMLIGAGLIGRTIQKVATFDFGYDARDVLQVYGAIRVWDSIPVLGPLRTREDSTFARLLRQPRIANITRNDLSAIVSRLHASSAIRDAAWVAADDADHDAVSSDETQIEDSVVFRPRLFNIGPGFFATLGLPILSGRDFVEGDRTTDGAAILDETSAQRLFPDGDAVGRMVKLGPPLSRTAQWIRVVGIVRNSVHDLPEFPELPIPVIYTSRAKPRFGPTFVLRGKQGPAEATRQAVNVVRTSSGGRSTVGEMAWTHNYDDVLKSRRFVGEIFTTLGIASLVLATAGLFGVLSYIANQRMREFAVRIALGATRRNVIRLVVRDGFVMALGGTAIGGIVGLAAGFAVYDWLWDVYPIDAVALVIAEAVLMAVTMASVVLPALRAARANPLDVMRAN